MLITHDRFAAYAAARSALTAIQRATSAWPRDLAQHAQTTANNVLTKTAEAIDKDPTSPARRRCLRDALVDALVLASILTWRYRTRFPSAKFTTNASPNST